jgi:UrcA family protein
MKTFLPLALAAAATALAASPAGAHTIHVADDGQYRVAIPYGDLNLANPAGVRALERRLKAATVAVCGRSTGKGVADARTASACRKSILEAARPQLALAVEPNKGSVALASMR